MSKKKPAKCLSQPSAVSNFINNQENENSNDDDDADDSLKYFKSIKSTIKKTQPPSAQSGSAVLGFINNASQSPKKVTKKTSTTTRKPATRKKKQSQPDIRKLLSKNDQLIHKVLEDSCREDNLDPDDVQLAIALSESIKESTENQQKFENPLQVSGKVQNVNSVLERFGFKTGKGLSAYEQEILTASKFSKRSKFQKAPTLLTRTSKEQREEAIQNRVIKVIDQEAYEEHGVQVSIDFDINSPHLQDFHMQHNKIASLENSEEPCDNVIQSYYVTELFQPSFLQADHLLKDWNQIPGRDRSPQKNEISFKVDEVVSSEDVWRGPEDEKIPSQKLLEEETNEEKEQNIPSINSSSSDIFADIESFKIDSCLDISHVSQQLDILHEKLSKTDLSMEVDDDKLTDDIFVIESDGDEPTESVSKSIGDQLVKSSENSSAVNRKSSHISIKSDKSVLNESDDTIEYEIPPSVPYKLTQLFLSQTPLKIVEEVHDLTQEEKFIETPEKSAEICDLTQVDDRENSQNNDENSTQEEAQASQNSSADIIDISDDEINYSMQPFENNYSEPQNEDYEILEIDNIASNENSPVKNYEELTFKNLLNETSELLRTPTVVLKSNQSTHKFFADENLSHSIQEIIRKYGGKKSESPKQSSFKKYPSESSIKLNNSSNNKLDLTQISDNVVDLTQHSNEVLEELERSNEILGELENRNDIFQELENSPDLVLESSINQSFANIINSPAIVQSRKSLVNRRKSRKSLLTVSSENYDIDTENAVPEPDYKSMTPAELKQELFKYGIRPLPVKKATELLQHIHDSIHPKVRVAVEEEIDDSRMDMNQTDIVSNIVCNGDDDDFVFKYGELEGEEFFLPKMKKSKIPSCAVPLQIAFYNMIRSNTQLQKFILEFRPLDLDAVHKHFRKFGLGYQLNDIIAFLDKRCITFKTKDQSYSKTHEAKKQKRLKLSQKN